MEEYLEFDYHLFDSFRINSSTLTHTLFVNPGVEEANRKNITDEIEETNIDWLFKQNGFEEHLYRKIGLDPARSRRKMHVKPNKFDSFRSDSVEVDCICIQNDDYTKATCVEFKNFKVIAYNNSKTDVRDLSRITPLVDQGNTRQSKGFHRVFICAIVTIDSSQVTDDEKNILFRGQDSPRIKILYNIHKEGNLHEDVGFLVIQILQPSSKSFNDFAGYGIAIAKNGNLLDQRPALSSDIKKIFKIKE
jgi:hypothetical protein